MKAMDEVKNLECSLKEPRGVGGAERTEGSDGNWRSPPRPGTLRDGVGARRPITGDEPGSGQPAGRVAEGAVVPLEPDGQHNRR